MDTSTASVLVHRERAGGIDAVAPFYRRCSVHCNASVQTLAMLTWSVQIVCTNTEQQRKRRQCRHHCIHLRRQCDYAVNANSINVGQMLMQYWRSPIVNATTAT